MLKNQLFISIRQLILFNLFKNLLIFAIYTNNVFAYNCTNCNLKNISELLMFCPVCGYYLYANEKNTNNHAKSKLILEIVYTGASWLENAVQDKIKVFINGKFMGYLESQNQQNVLVNYKDNHDYYAYGDIDKNKQFYSGIVYKGIFNTNYDKSVVSLLIKIQGKGVYKPFKKKMLIKGIPLSAEKATYVSYYFNEIRKFGKYKIKEVKNYSDKVVLLLVSDYFSKVNKSKPRISSYKPQYVKKKHISNSSFDYNKLDSKVELIINSF